MKNEIWKDVVGYEGRYQISSMCRVKSLARKVRHWRGGERIQKERILKPITDHYGYQVVNLYTGGKQKMLRVHRLVCEAFHENPDGKPCVNHIDENKTNNCASNLEWCTSSENNNHGTRTERSAKALSKPIGQYTLDGELVKTWSSVSEAQRQTGFSRGNISQAANGKYKNSHGFIWEYV